MTMPLYTPDRRELELRTAFCRAFAEEVPEAFNDPLGRSDEELTDWAHRWNVDVPWIIEQAKRTVELEERYPTTKRSVLWMSGGGVKIPVPETVELVIQWDPSLPGGLIRTIHREPNTTSVRMDEQVPSVEGESSQTERFHVTVGGASRKDAWKALLEAWKIYAAEVVDRYRKVGFEKKTERTGGGNVPMHERMRWLVWRVVRQMKWTEIAKQAERSRTTVETNVKNVGRALRLIESSE